eukprot:Skav210216  [mRNA]  locus=scaffold2492:60925:64216:+ [translate_table: standard]
MICTCCENAAGKDVAEVDTHATISKDETGWPVQLPSEPIPEGDFEVVIEPRPDVDFGIEVDLIDVTGPDLGWFVQRTEHEITWPRSETFRSNQIHKWHDG